MSKRILSKGMKFGRLIVIEDLYIKRGGSLALVRCECGKIKKIICRNLRNGNTKSCGCIQREMASKLKKSHCDSFQPEYRSWIKAKSRCENPKEKCFKHYGGRGIKFLFESYGDFLAHLGPSPHHSLDRFPDNNGNYQKGNVRWATRIEQLLNRRIIRKSGLPRGVSVVELKNKNYYVANITINKKQKRLGKFPSIIAAEKTFLFAYFREYKDLPMEYHGDDGRYGKNWKGN